MHTANLFTIAQRHGCFVLNLWGMGGAARLADVVRGAGSTSRPGGATAASPWPRSPHWGTAPTSPTGTTLLPLPPADRGTRREELRGPRHVGPHSPAGPWVQRRLQGR